MGWIGWTEQQTLDTHMTAIVLAYEGRSEMIRRTLEAVFGAGSEEPPQVIAEPMPGSVIQNTLRSLAG